jgi:phosphoribosylamine--glycine ligase
MKRQGGVVRKERVLVVGSGGREHALAWALARSPQVERVYVAPGNAGTEWPAGAGRAASRNVAVAAEDIAELIRCVREQEVTLTVVGPEVPLAMGVVDAFQTAGLTIFGPGQAAAQLESSKAFAKQFMSEARIPTAAYATFGNYEAARRFLEGETQPGRGWVVKASGLAAGKGVVVCDNAAEAEAAVRQMMVERKFGAAGEVVVIEERLSGRELSLMAFSDGRTVVLMPPARDHKRVYDGDQGPNTGGMGAYAPAPDVDEALLEMVTKTVLQPAVDGMVVRGTPYVGVLYAGIMLTAEGPKALEFNCRFGDPETQVILPLLASDLVEVMRACIDGQLERAEVVWRPGACATVVMAAAGYPEAYGKGEVIRGVEEAAALEGVVIFQAGTARRDGRLVTNGGRVLAVSGVGADLAMATGRAYEGVQKIRFEGAHYRRDIGYHE